MEEHQIKCFFAEQVNSFDIETTVHVEDSDSGQAQAEIVEHDSGNIAL